ncbi:MULTISPECIES: S8 family serine peptidase [unclassified Streptomyces]|uniref:S8 family peptidase n=1 Tax=unclassified Streptomyces TaxID=2593676 RepID=UPI0036EA4DCD
MPPRRRRPWAHATLAVTAMAAVAGVMTPTASADEAETSKTPPKQALTTHRVTLVTGDVVTVTTRSGDDHPTITLDPTGPSRGLAQISRTDDATYVLPLAANEAVSSNAVDLELFDVDGLIADGYDDASTGSLPLLLDNQKGGKEPVAPASARVDHRLRSIHSLGTHVPKGKAAAFWKASDTAGERTSARIGKIWLDAKVTVQLADSVPQIGAPEMWKSGYDGKGVKVAVLDTGVDTTHPDLRGRVSAEKNFTSAADAGDHFGHGTHVAATIGGSGAGNGAKGVAPGADLINGKVLGDSGSGALSDIISGMEWAASSGADVISMSLGTSQPDDGSGPLSAAADRLTDQYGSLFVVAAGNSGPNTIGQPSSATQALTVGAVSKSDALAPFSSTGPRIGDFAIKPEVTAPGVDIVAARASGTTMGTPVDDLYTTASGTSMATPHVSGAAALLKQAHPDWTWDRLKSALVTSADKGDYRADQGGAGRVNVPRAATQQAHATPAALNLGPVRYAEDGAYTPVSGEVTLHNDASTERVFSLTAGGANSSGAAMPTGALALDKGTVTVPAGGTATVTVTVDPNVLAREASYSGIVTAVAADSSASLRVPFSVHIEPLLQELKVTGIGRDGRKSGGGSMVTLYSDASGQPFRIYRAVFRDGVATVRVKPGVYAAQAMLLTPDASGNWVESVANSYRTEIDLTESDTAYTLDARKAEEVAFATGRTTEFLGGALSYYRMTKPGAYNDTTLLIPADIKHVHLFPSTAPATGTQQITVHSTLVAPQLTATVPGARGITLNPTQLDGATKPEGSRSLRLADVGTGTDEEFRRAGVRGKLVLATATGAVPISQVIDTAAARGAAAVAISHDGPGRMVAPAGSQALPAFALYGEDGTALSRLAASREVVVKLTGTPYSPYAYQLTKTFTDTVPEGALRVPVDASNTVHVTARNHARGTTTGVSVLCSRRTENFNWILGTAPTRLGAVQEQWMSADSHLQHMNGLDLGGTGLVMWDKAAHVDQPGVHKTVDWLKAVNNAKFDAGNSSALAQYYSTYTGESTLSLSPTPFPDNDPTHFALTPIDDTYSLTVTRDGEQVGQSSLWLGSFKIPNEKASYRAVLEASRALPEWEFATHTTTTWTFEAGGSTAYSTPISMPQISYDAHAGLDNRVDAGRPQTLTVNARSWFEDGADVTDVKTWASYDDGRSWHPLTLKPTGETGDYRATFTAPRSAASSGYVSLRTQAVDAQGHKVDQTVDRAFGVTKG